jgi:hypothetical protein
LNATVAFNGSPFINVNSFSNATVLNVYFNSNVPPSFGNVKFTPTDEGEMTSSGVFYCIDSLLNKIIANSNTTLSNIYLLNPIVPNYTIKKESTQNAHSVKFSWNDAIVSKNSIDLTFNVLARIIINKINYDYNFYNLNNSSEPISITPATNAKEIPYTFEMIIRDFTVKKVEGKIVVPANTRANVTKVEGKIAAPANGKANVKKANVKK